MRNEIEQQARAIERGNFQQIKEFLIVIGEKLDSLDIIDKVELDIIRDSINDMENNINSMESKIKNNMENNIDDMEKRIKKFLEGVNKK